ncbi:hypothetical protein LIER_30841 [Lithospermum erythrorhizon]|uniref:Uncharacterized protein n=1 Tax=Lithospermum erythrorhizon TaxID=34254 RepID=A0AAV3RRC6_LITER
MSEMFIDSLQLDKDRDTQKAVLEEEEEEEEEEEFSFFCDNANGSPIAAEDAFVNGQIKPIYPLFNQDLLLQESGYDESFPMNPHVKKVFIEMKNDPTASSDNDEVSGPCCDLSEKPATEPEGCKKSNSTGFSKLWRFKDLLHRSNSDGRDAFVFLNNHHQTTSNHQKTTRKEEEEEKAKKGGKKKTTTVSAHEAYLKNKAKENDRRKSYLPYRPEVFGFFTNVNGGMSKNVHPF